MSTSQLPTVSVVIAAFSSDRWDYLQDAVNSVRAQTVPVLETVVVIDHNPELLARAQRELEGTTVVTNARNRGASGSRNTGVALCRAEIAAFLDDDACADKDWLEALLPHFADAGVVGVGGRVDPLWATSRPRWFPPEFDWTVGASATMPIGSLNTRTSTSACRPARGAQISGMPSATSHSATTPTGEAPR